MNEVIKVLVLNGSLKHSPSVSNTQEVTELVLSHMQNYGSIEVEHIRLADKNIPVGLGFKEGEGDE